MKNSCSKGIRSCLSGLFLTAIIFFGGFRGNAVLGNEAPKVEIFTPPSGASFKAPANIMVAAWAQDADGYLTIQTVEFFANSISLGIRTNFPTLDPIGPFKIDWTNVDAGQYVLIAKATDEWGATGVSDPVSIRVGSSLVFGGLKREVYTNVPGLLVSDLTNHYKFPLKPDLVGSIQNFEVPSQFGENYGQRLTGYLVPRLTGEYRFYVASDDQGALFLSPDMDPNRKVQIAWESSWNFPRNWATDFGRVSAPIALQAGNTYYVEALHKEAGGGDNFAVAWQLPGEDPPIPGSEPISGDYLATLSDVSSNLPPRVSIVKPADGAVFDQGETINMSILAVSKNSAIGKVELFSDAQSLGTATHVDSNFPTNFAFAWTNASPGQHSLTARAWDSTGLTSTSAPVRITIQSFEPSLRELHVVGLYSGSVNGHSSQNNEEGIASVTVNRPGKRVTLFLSAYEPVVWMLSVSSETTIEKVILGGCYPQRVEGLPAGVEILPLWYNGGSGNYLYMGYSLESSRFYEAVPKLLALTGLEIASFHGAYTAPYPIPFIIDSVQDDPRLRSDYPQPTPVSQLPNLNFSLSFFSGSGPGGGEVFFRDYTLAGPVRGGDLLPGMRVVADQTQRYYYAAYPHAVLQVDSQTGVGSEMNLGAGVPELSWPMGMAFDSNRQRVLLVSLGGEGFLYSYSSESGLWSLVSSMNNRDLDSLVYHPAQDALYGFEVYRSDYSRPKLFRFTPEGAYLKELVLPPIQFDIGVSGYQSELVSVGDYVVLLVGPDRSSGLSQTAESRMYLIDPRSGETWLTYRHTGPANLPPVVEITAPSSGAVLAAGTPVDLLASASDPDGKVQSVEFFLNGRSLGLSEPVSGGMTFKKAWASPEPGSYQIMAKALDDDLATGFSSSIAVSVQSNGPLPDLTFRLAFSTTNKPGMGRVFYKDYTLNGPKEPGPLLPGMRITPTAGQRFMFAASPFTVLKVDSLTGEVDELPVQGPNVPELSWPMGMAFDAVRNRALLVSLGGEGFLYSYNVDQNAWSVVSSMHDLDVDSLVYHEAADAIYGFEVHRGTGPASIYKFSPQGVRLGQFQLPAIPYDVGVADHQSELVSVGEYLVLFIAPEFGLTPTKPMDARMYVIDPRSGQFWLAFQQNETLPPPVVDWASFVTRSFSGAKVTLTAVPPPGVQVYAVEDRIPQGWVATELSSEGIFDRFTGKAKFGPFFDGESRVLTYTAAGATPPGAIAACDFEGLSSADGLIAAISGDHCMPLAYPHPADLAPLDWRMSMEELTAYAVAWRTGGVWVLPPNPIPIDYVTRAAALWRGGEIYKIDASLGGPPAWWVNGTAPVKILARHSELSSSITRIVPRAFGPGDTLKIAIQVTPASSTLAYAVEEALSPGTVPASISHGGVLDPASRLIKWGPFLDAAPRVLEYQLLTGNSISSDISFRGHASFDGTGAIPEGGILTRCGALLTCAPQPGTSDLLLRLRGIPGASYTLESSVDLEHWTAVTTITNAGAETVIHLTPRDIAGKRYYRGKRLP